MEIFKVNLRIRDCIDKEWMLSNGIGGYAMQTVSGTNTRSYHGLLIASLNAPLNRNLIFSNFLEDIYIEDRKYTLSTNMNTSYVSDGYKNLKSFKYKYGPEIDFKIKDKNEEIEISKKIQMENGSNTTCLIYDIEAKSKDVYFNLTPLLNYRDFHSVNSNLDLFQEVIRNDKNEEKVKYSITNTNEYFNEENSRSINLYISISDSKYEIINKKYNDMHYIKEKERGFKYNEDLLMPGVFKIHIRPFEKKRIYIYISTDKEEKNVEKIFFDEEKRKKEIVKKANLKLKEEIGNAKKDNTKRNLEDEKISEFLEDLALSSDYFLVDREDKKTIIAGFPWFADWGRDALISLEGLLLKTNRFKEAKKVLEKLGENLCWGLIPNSYNEYTKEPLYNSADSSLLYINALKTYLNYTDDEAFIKKNLKNIREIVKLYELGTNYDGNNIYEDKDGLLNTGTEETQNTWMDAKIGNIPVTPRNGKAVEMSALWYNARMILAEFEEKYGTEKNADILRTKAEKTKKSFLKEFKSKRKGLKDLIDDDVVRPNQLFALWTNYEIVDPKSNLAKEIIEIVSRRLKNRYGLKTLEKGPKYYVDEYSGNSFKRDMSYHQGISWVWLLELYFEAVRKRSFATNSKKDIENYNDFLEDTFKTYIEALYQKQCVMSLNELNDSTFPYNPGGAISQAWSVAAIIKILTK